MRKSRRNFNKEQKLAIIRELESGKPLAEVCRENEIHESVVTRWKKEYLNNPENAFGGKGNARSEGARVGELERAVGRLFLENEFLKKTLKRLEENLQHYRRNGRVI